MQYEQYGQLFFDAIRETLETMAFTEVVPYSMKIGERELLDPDLLRPTVCMDTNLSDTKNDFSITDYRWTFPLDSWGEYVKVPSLEESEIGRAERIDFDKLMNEQKDWCWACMKVNSPELDSVWFIASKQLSLELARTMCAGNTSQFGNPVLNDIIAELTNVLGGRLVMLLEEIIGRFTLAVPKSGIGRPELPNNMDYETVISKVFVDGVHPVIGVMCFKKNEQPINRAQSAKCKAQSEK